MIYPLLAYRHVWITKSRSAARGIYGVAALNNTIKYGDIGGTSAKDAIALLPKG